MEFITSRFHYDLQVLASQANWHRAIVRMSTLEALGVERKPEDYVTKAEEEAEEDHLAPSRVAHRRFSEFQLTTLQAMVVFFHSFPSDSGHVWTFGHGVQYLCVGNGLAGRSRQYLYRG